jgi:hypothetical protein
MYLPIRIRESIAGLNDSWDRRSQSGSCLPLRIRFSAFFPEPR